MIKNLFVSGFASVFLLLTAPGSGVYAEIYTGVANVAKQGAGLNIDFDHDGINNRDDAFPRNPAESVDTDGDGIGNNSDEDDDNDGQLDRHEITCGSDPLNNTSFAADMDGDNLPDCFDLDDDNDGVAEC